MYYKYDTWILLSTTYNAFRSKHVSRIHKDENTLVSCYKIVHDIRQKDAQNCY